MTRNEGPELHEDLRLERREWRLERVAVWALTGLMLAAALGVFGGGGLLSRAVRSDRTGAVRVEYDRFQRYGASTSLVVHVDASLAREGRLSVALDHRYLSRIELRAITPEPMETEVGVESVVFRFATRATTGSVLVRFSLQPTRRGLQSGRLAVDGIQVGFRSFVYP